MNEKDKNHFKEILEAELSKLEGELGEISRKNPDNPSDWEAMESNGVNQEERSEPNEIADKIEEYEERTGVVKELEKRYNDIKRALKKTADDTYGKCEVCDELIKKDRLDANPAARTCTEHKDMELS